MSDRDPLDPTLIDWDARQAAASIPFEVVNGRPIKPGTLTGLKGLNDLWFWGPQECVDAFVFVRTPGWGTYLLMIDRKDGHGWAVPGGKIDPGETEVQALVRELAEETGLKLCVAGWNRKAPRVVPDPRGSDEAWMTTVPFVTYLWLDHLPEVRAASDARAIAWVRADDHGTFLAHLNGPVFAAHEAMIADVMGA